MTALLDLTGQTFTRLHVLRRAENGPRGVTRWWCRCECGTEKAVRSRELVTSGTKSCGCLKAEAAATTGRRNRRHDVSYGAVHRRNRLASPASSHLCVDCAKTAAEWSYDGTDPDELRDERGCPYSLKAEHYVPRCRPCHRKFDYKLPVVA